MEPEDMMYLILDNACALSVLEDGWKLYAIETHCYIFTITARRDGNRQGSRWEIKSYEIEVA